MPRRACPPQRADAALLRSVELARSVVAEFPGRRVRVAGSLGPFGAALHNGAEYTGDYDCSYADLVAFHAARIAVLAAAEENQAPDLLAFETLPSLEEARAIGEALAPWPDLACWFSFTCRDAEHVAHGERLSDCAAEVARLPQTAAIGVNCTPPAFVTPSHRRTARGLRETNRRLSQLRRGMGRRAPRMDGLERSGSLWNPGGRVVSRRSPARRRMLPHAPGAHSGDCVGSPESWGRLKQAGRRPSSPA